MADGLQQAIEKMRADRASDIAIENFRHYYERLARGETGTIPEDEIEPARDLPKAADLPEPDEEGHEALDRTVTIRLNGGLGTRMGMTAAQTLLQVKEEMT